jgi:type VII secretion-associated serine protease mycosin
VTRTARLRAAALVLVLIGAGGATSANAAEILAVADEDCAPGIYTDVPPPALTSLQTTEAWKHSTGRGVTVAVVDSGIDASNVHLAGVVIGGINLVGDGENAQGLVDQDGHGTAIAGQIAARPVEGSTVIGIAPSATLLSVRVFAGQDTQSVDAGHGPTAARISEGIRWAADNGAIIINVSLSDFTEGSGLLDAVTYATARGALVVASAGNRGTTGFTEDSVRYPAGYPGVLGVSATNEFGVVTDDSIHGPQVAVAAPGVTVVTAGAGAGDCIYATEAASTSFATGYTSGAAALVASAHPTETPAQWKYRLEATALRANPDARDDVSGWGVIQPLDAITLVPSASTRGPESPFADNSGSAVQQADVVVEPRPSDSPFAVTKDAMLYLVVGTTSVTAVLGVLITYRRFRRAKA